MTRRLALLADAKSYHTQRWACEFVRRGWHVAVASLRPAAIPGVESLDLRPGRGGRLGYFTVLPRLRRWLAEFAPDLVHAHYATSYGLLGALGGRRPLIISVWGSDVYEWPTLGPLQAALLRHNLARADALLATSGDLAAATRPWAPRGSEIAVTPFGIDTERFRPATEPHHAPLVVGSVRSLEWRYGLDILIKAFAMLPEGLDVRLRLVGDGPHREDYQRLARELGLGDRVEFLGHVPSERLVEVLQGLDLFVAPSRIEAFCVAALEAEACGVPAVVSRVGGLPEVVEDGVTGAVIAPESPEALARTLVELLADPARRRQMGRAAREHVLRHYRWQECADRMAALYDQVLERRERPQARA